MNRLLLTTLICSGLPMAAAAQGMACQGVPEGSWIGGTPEASDLATAGMALDMSSFVPVGGEVVAMFTLSTPASVRYEAMASFGGDPIAWLYDASGAEISFNDDGAADYGVQGVVDLAPGSYCLTVGDVNGGLLPVDVRIGRTDHEPLQDAADWTMPAEDGCFELGNLTEIDLSTPFAQTFPIDGPRGVAFTLSQPQALTLTATGYGNDPYIEIESETDGYVADNDDTVGLDARIDLSTPLAPGRYCVSLNTYSEDGSEVELAIKPLDLEELKLVQINAGEISPLIGGGHPITDLGVLTGRLIQDVEIGKDMSWFSVSVDSASVIVVESLAVNGSDPVSVMFDDAGRQLDWNDDFGTDYSSRVMAPVSAGTYLIGVANYNETPEPTRMIFDLYTRQR